jgi:hypothetical protein
MACLCTASDICRVVTETVENLFLDDCLRRQYVNENKIMPETQGHPPVSIHIMVLGDGFPALADHRVS